ncbi:MAG: high frequency lysogenization protein HflD [Armatimonadota bacterium]|nr:MAG: high frequency lysogenization protein HflD [Armatimonadota bacterium]
MEYMLMLASAFGLGAAHALEPGHGKTVVAAYLVGSRGRTVDAIVLGGVVTLTHTFSVYVLAIIGAVAAAYLVPEQVERWLAIGSGLLVVSVGAWMIYVRTKHGPPVHRHSHADHSHAHHHSHNPGDGSHTDDHHHDHSGTHAGTHADAAAGRRVGIGPLVALGVSGGIVPCPAALLLIPAAIGLGAITKGLTLVVSFSLGLALVLMAIGILTVRAAGFASGWLERGDWARRMSIASAYFITLLGLALVVKALWLAPHAH